MGLFDGMRVQRSDIAEDKGSDRDRPGEQKPQPKVDHGLLCFLKTRGTVLLKDILSKKPRQLASEQSDLSIMPISMDPNIYQDIPKSQIDRSDQDSSDKQQEDKYHTNSLQCLLGTKDGAVYIFDPVLIQQG